MDSEASGNTRHVVMFSSGCGSAGAAKRVSDRYGPDDVVLLFADVNGEHGDNYRFLREAAKWVGGNLVVLHNDGKTIWQTFSEVRFLGNSRVDPCSRILKREPLRRWIEENCDPSTTVIYLGYDWTEEHRWLRAQKHWSPWTVECPLGMPGQSQWSLVSKASVLEQLRNAGVNPPLLTRRGFPHANCGGGCVKAGVKQFKRLLEVDPATFSLWEWNEERLREQLGDVAILIDRRDGRHRPLPLRELRERIEGLQRLDFGGAEEEWGGCSCFSPTDDGEAA